MEISGKREELLLSYEENVSEENFSLQLEKNREAEKKQQTTLSGPHRDDLSFQINGQDIRHFGSQGQQRTAALSLKLAEIDLVRERIQDNPILLLDDVFSELDQKRQNFLLEQLGNLQSLTTCTGLEELVKHRFPIDHVFYVENGQVQCQ